MKCVAIQPSAIHELASFVNVTWLKMSREYNTDEMFQDYLIDLVSLSHIGLRVLRLEGDREHILFRSL